MTTALLPLLLLGAALGSQSINHFALMYFDRRLPTAVVVANVV
jgi:hypothetical protein